MSIATEDEPQLLQWIKSQPTHVQLIVGTILGELFWFAFALFPLFPNTTIGWFAALGIGAIFGPSVFLLGWLQRQSQLQPMYKAIGIVVAVSIGAGILWLALNQQAFIQANFSPWGR